MRRNLPSPLLKPPQNRYFLPQWILPLNVPFPLEPPEKLPWKKRKEPRYRQLRRSRLQRRLLQLRVQSIQKFVFSQYILLSGTLWMPSLTIAHFFLFFHPHRRKNRIASSVRTAQIHKNGRPSTGFRPFFLFS